MKTTGCIASTLLVVCLLSGCQTFNEEDMVFHKYYQTTLDFSTSADVLDQIQDPLDEYLSQSESVVVSWNERDEGKTHWFNMVAFDEETLRAVRKYGFSLVEQNLSPNTRPNPMMRLDAELLMDPEILDAVYPSHNARYIAVLEEVQAKFLEDTAEVVTDSQVLHSSTMMVRQALETVLLKLRANPAMAVRLPWLEGVAFDHPLLNESRIRMLILDNRVLIKLKSAPAWFKEEEFDEQPDVIYM